MKNVYLLLVTAIIALSAPSSDANEFGEIGSIPGWAFSAVDVAIDAIFEVNPSIDIAYYDIIVSQHNKQSILITFVVSDQAIEAESNTHPLISEYQVLVSIDDNRVIYTGPIE